MEQRHQGKLLMEKAEGQRNYRQETSGISMLDMRYGLSQTFGLRSSTSNDLKNLFANSMLWLSPYVPLTDFSFCKDPSVPRANS